MTATHIVFNATWDFITIPTLTCICSLLPTPPTKKSTTRPSTWRQVWTPSACNQIKANATASMMLQILKLTGSKIYSKANDYLPSRILYIFTLFYSSSQQSTNNNGAPYLNQFFFLSLISATHNLSQALDQIQIIQQILKILILNNFDNLLFSEVDNTDWYVISPKLQFQVNQYMFQFTIIIKQQMFVIRVLVFIMIHVLLTFEQSTGLKIVQKNVHFLTDIQPEYSVTAQIYQEIVQKQKPKQVRIAPQPALQTKSQPKPTQPPVHQRVQPPVQAKQEQITRQNLNAQKFKLNIQAQIQFQDDQGPTLKQQRLYTINNIDERFVMQNGQKIAPLQLKTTVESKPAQHLQPTQHTQQHSQQIPLQPVQGQNLNPPTSAPQSTPFFFAPRQRVPVHSRQQQILDALQRRRQSDPTPISQRRQETPEKEVVKQTKRNQLRQQQSHTKAINTTKLLFALFLMLSMLIIVFSYSPEQQKPARKAYNPNEDEEINLA